MSDAVRCSECNSNVTGERVVCFGCHEAIVADATAAQAVQFVPCPDYREGQSHPECPRCGGFGAIPAPPADAATEDTGYPPTLADARMHVERLTRSLSQPHSADERFFAINEARTWLAKTAAAKADAATEAVRYRAELEFLSEWLLKFHGSINFATVVAMRERLRAALSTPAAAATKEK